MVQASNTRDDNARGSRFVWELQLLLACQIVLFEIIFFIKAKINSILKGTAVNDMSDRGYLKDLAVFLRFGFVPKSKPFQKPWFDDDPSLGSMARIIESSNQSDFFVESCRAETMTGGRSYVFSEFDQAWINAVNNINDKSSPIGILLSGGKDSTAIAYGLSRAGFKNVTGYTYVPLVGENEAKDAQLVCQALGYKHKIVNCDFKKDFQAWFNTLSSSSAPSGDFAFPAVCRVLDEMKTDGVSIVLDGMGNDVYMGHIPPKVESTLKRASLVNLFRKFAWSKDHLFYWVGSWKIRYLVSSIMMHPLERMFPGTRLSVRELKRLNLPTDWIWQELVSLEKKSKHLPEHLQRAYIRGLLFDQFCAMQKTKIAAEANDVKIMFPFADYRFCQYYCSLKNSERYNWSNRKNKVSLRKYLSDLREIFGISEETYNSSKGSFRFNFSEFIENNKLDIRAVLLSDDESESFADLRKFALRLLVCKRDYFQDSKLFLIISFLIWAQATSSVDADNAE